MFIILIIPILIQSYIHNIKLMLHEMFQTYKLGMSERDLLNSTFDKSIERVKAFDNVRRIEFCLLRTVH